MRALVMLLPLAGSLALASVSGAAASLCDAGRTKAHEKTVSCLLKLDAKAYKKASAVDPLKEQKCRDRFVATCATAEARADCTTAVKACADLATQADTCRDAGSSAPASMPSQCDASKVKEYAKKVSCLEKLDAKALLKGVPVDPLAEQKCETKFADRCASAEARGDCTASVEPCAVLATEAAACRDAVVGCRDGDGLCPVGCVFGDDADCPRFTDSGATVLDVSTNLEWEKKDTPLGSGADPANLHDVDNLYAWAGRCSVTLAVCQQNAAAAATCAAHTGGVAGCEECGPGEGTCDLLFAFTPTTIWDWLNQLNAASFAGHSDWRIPTLGFEGDPAELESILDCGFPQCTDPVFGPTSGNGYWSASASDHPSSAGYAYGMHTSGPAAGEPFEAGKWNGSQVRAVRNAGP